MTNIYGDTLIIKEIDYLINWIEFLSLLILTRYLYKMNIHNTFSWNFLFSTILYKNSSVDCTNIWNRNNNQDF